LIFWAFLGPLSGDVSWVSVFALALLAGILSLDETSLAQTWLCQPLPAGVLAGAVCGDLGMGLAVGLPFQLISIGNLPVGQTFTGERISSVVAGVGAAALLGQPLPIIGRAGMAAQASALGWILLAVVLISLLGNQIVQLERRMHFLWMLEGHRGLRDGDVRRFDRLQVRCLAATGLRGAVLTWLWLVVMIAFWMPMYERLPDRLVSALAYLPLMAPPIAIGVLIDRYGARACWRWVTGGLILTFVILKYLL
jgi:mannose/fructose/N-acetylgalactosamine-specific phosphotransferase system component IIC